MSDSQPRRKPKQLSFPDDVVYDILTRVPVKSVIRFRCVSKSCNSIITNPIFITTHLDRAKSLSHNNNNNGYLLYIPRATNSSLRNELCIDVCNSDHTVSHVSRFQIPFSLVRIFGFCNGIICLYSSLNLIIYLWNPSIKKFKICDGTNLTRRRPAVTVGLAYHSQNNDFKILRIQRSNGTLYEAEVYTLSTDSWRKVVISVDSLSGSIDRIIESPCLFFNGALHTIACSRDHKFILSFDVNDEIFQPIMLPQNYTDIIFFESLAVFKGLLALFVYSEDPDVDMGICYIWVMREYGVVESWTRKSVPVDLFVWSFFCTDSGELLINTADRGVISYDPVSLNEKYLKIRRPLWLGYTADLMESLVLLDQVKMSSKYED